MQILVILFTVLGTTQHSVSAIYHHSYKYRPISKKFHQAPQIIIAEPTVTVHPYAGKKHVPTPKIVVVDKPVPSPKIVIETKPSPKAPSPASSPVPTPSPTPTPTPKAPSPLPSPSPLASPEVAPIPSPSPKSSPKPSPTATPEPVLKVSPSPLASPEVAPIPSPTPSPKGIPCNDVPPDAQYTCVEQASFGRCNAPFMEDFCDLSCDRCTF